MDEEENYSDEEFELERDPDDEEIQRIERKPSLHGPVKQPEKPKQVAVQRTSGAGSNPSNQRPASHVQPAKNPYSSKQKPTAPAEPKTSGRPTTKSKQREQEKEAKSGSASPQPLGTQSFGKQ